MPSHDRDRKTELLHSAREFCEHGFVNPAVYRGSTVLARSLAEYESGARPYTYATHGTPTTRALESALARIEGAHGCRLASSGLLAITATLLSLLEHGDHVLVSDSVYGPTRRFMDSLMGRLGVTTQYFDPRIDAAGLQELMRPETSVVFLESPGSNTMEMLDVPALAGVARASGAVTVIDNTWSAGWLFDALGAGCDVSIQAATKYQGGHSDVLMGAVCYTQALAGKIEEGFRTLGVCVGGDDAWLTLRGLRTMEVRLKRHQENALKVAGWLRERAEVAEVLYPALPGAPGHELWKRDFTGACGLFSIALNGASEAQLHAFVDSLELFGIGASWGGYESLILRFDPHAPGARTASRWPLDGPLLRLHIGLEEADDLIADLEQAFAAMKRIDP